MLVYILIGLSLSLAGIVGLQLAFGIYRDRLDNDRKQRLAELEKKCRILVRRLNRAERRISEMEAILPDQASDTNGDDSWADIIEDR